MKKLKIQKDNPVILVRWLDKAENYVEQDEATHCTLHIIFPQPIGPNSRGATIGFFYGGIYLN